MFDLIGIKDGDTMIYLANAFSPSMLPKGLTKLTSNLLPLYLLQRLIEIDACVNCINPRHASTATALGLNPPDKAVNVSLARGDLLVVVTATATPRDGGDIHVTVDGLTASWWAVHEVEEAKATVQEIYGGDIGRGAWRYVGPKYLGDSHLVEIQRGMDWDMGGNTIATESSFLPAPLARVWFDDHVAIEKVLPE